MSLIGIYFSTVCGGITCIPYYLSVVVIFTHFV